MNLEHYTLPEHWASALLYGDDSGLEIEDARQLQAWEDSVTEDGNPTLVCVSVDCDEGGDFRRYHDATSVGVLACNVARFTFDRGVR